MVPDEARVIRQDSEGMRGEMLFFDMAEKCRRPHWVYPLPNDGGDEDNRVRCYSDYTDDYLAIHQSNMFASLRRE
jgi:uncharacterized protein with von Willebrand factor type A (vWA) domain